MDQEMKRRIVKTLEWTTTQLKVQYDEQRNAGMTMEEIHDAGEGNLSGGYSGRLTEAIDLLQEVKRVPLRKKSEKAPDLDLKTVQAEAEKCLELVKSCHWSDLKRCLEKISKTVGEMIGI